jgi:hypothetical protein
MGVIAAMLLQRYELCLPPGHVRPEPELNVTLRPRGGLQLMLTRRKA